LWRYPISQAGTIIHESFHFTANSGTNDYAYGQSAAKSLAISNLANAVMNADNHEYFAENNPVLSRAEGFIRAIPTMHQKINLQMYLCMLYS
jgi:hypothetical protein